MIHVLLFCAAFGSVFSLTIGPAAADFVYQDGFEGGWGDWFADNGLWEIGTPTAGPAAAYGGTNCAGTGLDGDYSGHTDSRLISPSMTLPTVSGNEEIRLCFRQWFSYNSHDYGVVQISLWDPDEATWSEWQDVSGQMVNVSPAWSRSCVDLTPYAGQKVKIAFFHYATRDSNGYGGSIASESTGWYIDDIAFSGMLLAPAIPATITYPSSDPDGSFTVSWSSVSDATAYTLQRDANASFSDAASVYSGPATTYNQTGLTGGTHYYRVRAFDPDRNSTWSNSASATTDDAEPPPLLAPSGLIASATSTI